jgi:GAF domain-containing protein
MLGPDPDRLAAALLDVIAPPSFTAFELEARLDEMVEVATRVLDVAGAALMLLDAAGGPGPTRASGETARRFACLQQTGGAGPGVQSVADRELVVVEDLDRDARWPELGRPPGAPAIGGVLSVPITVGPRVVGNLSLVEGLPRTWSDAIVTRARTLAEVTGIWLQTTLAAQAAGQLMVGLQRTLGLGDDPVDAPGEDRQGRRRG